MNDLAADLIAQIQRRQVGAGEFRELSAGGYRADATAWASLALVLAGEGGGVDGLERLQRDQHPDGRLPFQPGHVEVLWPTLVAGLGWSAHDDYSAPAQRAAEFVLSHRGQVGGKKPADPRDGHDPTLRGWPWVSGTHSWVEPTSLALMLLKQQAMTVHPYYEEGLRVLWDRQIPSGGWNFGNPFLYQTELNPFPESTGLALSALVGHSDRARVSRSIDYLRRALVGLRSPLSVSWGLLGLSAWGVRPDDAPAMIRGCLEAQARWGRYSTSLLAQLLIAVVCPAGLSAALEAKKADRR